MTCFITKVRAVASILLGTTLLFSTITCHAETDAVKRIAIHTSMGEIEAELYPSKAPKTVENFITYANQDFYAGTVFHRVIDGFMVQGGGFESNMKMKDALPPIPNEADNGLKNDKGTLSMARTNDPHSASSQFFINAADNDFLNFKDKSTYGWGYCVFGKVTKGQDVVDAITKVKTTNKAGHQNVPVKEIVIQSIEILE